MGVTQNWVPNFAKIAKPMTELMKLALREFEWNEEAQKAMDMLKIKAQEIVALKKLDIELAKKASITAKPKEYNEG